MSGILEGQTAIVTGAARGIGLGIAQRLSSDGAKVVIWDIDPSNLDAEAAGFEPLMTKSVDVSDAVAVKNAVDEAIAAAGSIEILVNNAGINGPVTPAWEYDVETWNRVLAVNLNGVFYGCRAIVPHMRSRGYGRIVNIASVAGKEGVQFISGYSAAKGGVIAFTKALAKEMATDGVTVNCIAPAMAETELFREMTQEHIEASRKKIPMGRFLQIPEVAAMTAWIAGPECSFTTGFTFDLTGGRATY